MSLHIRKTTLILCLLMFGCKGSPKLSFVNIETDTTIKASEVSIQSLTETYKDHQGQYIETTGILNLGFEVFAISNKKMFTKGFNSFWLDIDSSLQIYSDTLRKINGKKIRIKGIIDTTQKGHMNAYPATISKIYFLEEQ